MRQVRIGRHLVALLPVGMHLQAVNFAGHLSGSRVAMAEGVAYVVQ
jgi:hypothetical protein